MKGNWNNATVQNSFKFAPPFKALHFSYDIRNAWFTVLESLRAELLKEGILRGGAQSTVNKNQGRFEIDDFTYTFVKQFQHLGNLYSIALVLLFEWCAIYLRRV